MVTPCKHGHVDGALHEPCYECRAEYWQERAIAAEQRLERAVDENMEKVLKMTDEQISAVTRLEGHDPDDVAKIGKLIAESVILRKDATVVCEMLELGDQRLLAGDGPAGGQRPDLSPEEWGKVYRACKRIAKMRKQSATDA